MNPELLAWVKGTVPAVVGQLPVAGILLGSDAAKAYVSQYPIRAGAIFIFYELIVGLAIKVYKKLEEEIVNGLTGAVRGMAASLIAGLRKLSSPFRRAYLKQVIYEHRAVNLRGLRTIGTFNLRLEDIFIELRLSPNAPNQVSQALITAEKFQKCHSIWNFLKQGKSDDAHGWAIVGAPGSGKTTLLQNLALVFAQNRQAAFALPAYLPIMLYLREHIETINSTDAPDLSTLLEKHFIRRDGPKPMPGWLEQQLLNGRCLILLDGLDEVAKSEARQRVSVWVDRQITRYPRSRFVLSARPAGYQSAPLKHATVLAVQPFGPNQVHLFVKNWYVANEIMANGNQDDPGIRHAAAQRAEDFLDRMTKRPGLTALTANPLLLTMIVTVHRYRGALPGRRVELYEEICDVLLGHWRIAKGIQTPLTAAQHRAILQPLAAHLMVTNKRDIATPQALTVLGPNLAAVGASSEATRSYLPDVQASSGLLLERETNLWSFAHLTFQEYMAACHMREQTTAITIEDKVQDPWWHETLRLYAAQGDASALVSACITADSVSALTLAGECLEEARTLQPEVRLAVEDRLIFGLEDDAPERRRLAAEVRLARRLRNFARIDDLRDIDTEYLSCAEYQLFIDDMKAKGEYVQPEHWRSLRFSKGTASLPVTGMRWDDARSFCSWLNAHVAQDTAVYRLPTREELDAHPIQTDPPIASYCTAADGELLYGIESTLSDFLCGKLHGLSNVPILCLPSLSRIVVSQKPSAEPLRSIFEAPQTSYFIQTYRLRSSFLKLAEQKVSTDFINSYLFNIIGECCREWRSLTEREILDFEFEAFKRSLGPMVEGWMKIKKDITRAFVQSEAKYSMEIGIEGLEYAQSMADVRSALRQILASLFASMHEMYMAIDNSSRYRWWKPTIRLTNRIELHELSAQHWENVLLLARERNFVPAWEGIRLVREQRQGV